MIKNINKIKITKKDILLSALKIMDETYARLLLVVENDKFVSLLSIGDIQRAIINNHQLDEPVNNILRKKVSVATPNDDIEQVKNRMLQLRAEFMPIVDENNNIIKVIFWEDIFIENERPNRHRIPRLRLRQTLRVRPPTPPGTRKGVLPRLGCRRRRHQAL